MIYQLPNGRVIHLTIDQYLDLTDEDIQYMMSANVGDHVNSPWYGSAISKKKKKDPEEDVDKSMDFQDDDEDKSHGVGIDDEALDEFPEIPDNSDLD